MITNFKLFENWDIKNVNLYDIIKGHGRSLKRELLGKYVSFTSTSESLDSQGRHTFTSRIHNGVVEDILYSTLTHMVSIKLKGKNEYLNIPRESEITINLTRTESDKYNL